MTRLSPIPTGKRMTDFTVRAYATLRQRGPMRAGALARLLFPTRTTAQPAISVGGVLGKLSRCGLVGWSPITSEYHANPNPEMDAVVRERLQR